MPAAPTIHLSITTFLRDHLSRARTAWEARLREREQRRRLAIPRPPDTPWQRYWGDAYGLDLKQWLLKPLFEKLEHEGKVGDLIVDVGSGARPVSRFLPPRPGRKRILVDVAAENCASADEQKIRLNAEKIAQPAALSFRKALLRVCNFLEIPPAAPANAIGADTIVFSDLLNYVDFRKVLRGFARFLKPDGRIVIVNLPMRGNESLFSEKGLKDNRQLYEFLEEHHFEIEHKSFPCRPRGETDESGELIVLVARMRL
jgi:SAM-dependent methyltransferase